MATLTSAGYLDHLQKIQHKLSHFIDQVKKGEKHYLSDIALQLRILYLQSSGTQPLIKTIEDLFSIKASVYILWSLKDQVDRGVVPASSAEGNVFEQINSSAAWFENGNEMVNVLMAINRANQIKIGNKTFSVRDIIAVYANKLGGAHIDTAVKDADLLPHDQTFLIGGLSSADSAIFHAAKGSVELIERILQFIHDDKDNQFIKHV